MDELWELFTPVKFWFLHNCGDNSCILSRGYLQKYILHHIWYNTKTVFEQLASFAVVNFEHVGTWATEAWEFLGLISSWLYLIKNEKLWLIPYHKSFGMWCKTIFRWIVHYLGIFNFESVNLKAFLWLQLVIPAEFGAVNQPTGSQYGDPL